MRGLSALREPRERVAVRFSIGSVDIWPIDKETKYVRLALGCCDVFTER